MKYEIRSSELEDLERVQELSVRLSEKEAEEFDATIDPEWNTSEEATQYFKERITDEDGFAVVVEDDQVVGYAVGSIRDAEAYREDLQVAGLESMYVEPEYRSQGIGTEFMEEFEEWAENSNADRMRVEVTSQNREGIRFYEKNGLKDYARIMEKKINGEQE